MSKITVNIQREDRLRAIVELSTAIRKVSEALTAPVRVNIENCTIEASDTGISIDTQDKVEDEIIKEVSDES